jgi:hypothetical protein
LRFLFLRKREECEPKLVNIWKPVTGEWHETEIPAVEVKKTPDPGFQVAMAAAVRPRRRSARTPLLIAVYAAYCFLRSAATLAGLWVVEYAPDSEAAKSIYAATVPSIERIFYSEEMLNEMRASESRFDREEAEKTRENAVKLVPEYLMLQTVPFALSGVAWLLRSKKARMLTMLSAGYSAVTAAMNFVIARFVYADLFSTFSQHSSRIDLVIPGILLNLFIFLYLAYSPSVIEAYRDGED